MNNLTDMLVKYVTIVYTIQRKTGTLERVKESVEKFRDNFTCSNLTSAY